MTRKLNDRPLDRREFIGFATGVAVTTLLPFGSLVSAAPVSVPPQRELLADWTIDDMWGVYPRYAEAIDYPRPQATLTAALDPVDLGFWV